MLKSSEELFHVPELECQRTLQEEFYLAQGDNSLHYNKPCMQLLAQFAYKNHLSLRMTGSDEDSCKKEVRFLEYIINIIIKH